MDFALSDRVRRSALPRQSALPRLLVVILLLTVSSSLSALAQTPPATATSPAPPRTIDSRITSVTVFRDVAQVTRTAARPAAEWPRLDSQATQT